MLEKQQKDFTLPLLIGGVIGALLGASVAYMLVKAPVNLKPGEDPGDVKTGDILELTSTVTKLVRLLDDIRRKT